MSEQRIIDEHLLRFYVPASMRQEEADRVTRTLSSRRFQTALRHAVKTVVHRLPALRRVQVRLSR